MSLDKELADLMTRMTSSTPSQPIMATSQPIMGTSQPIMDTSQLLSLFNSPQLLSMLGQSLGQMSPQFSGQFSEQMPARPMGQWPGRPMGQKEDRKTHYDKSRMVRVTQLPCGITADELRAAFGKFGKIVEVKLVPFRNSPNNDMYGTIYYATRAAAMRCLGECIWLRDQPVVCRHFQHGGTNGRINNDHYSSLSALRRSNIPHETDVLQVKNLAPELSGRDLHATIYNLLQTANLGIRASDIKIYDLESPSQSFALVFNLSETALTNAYATLTNRMVGTLRLAPAVTTLGRVIYNWDLNVVEGAFARTPIPLLLLPRNGTCLVLSHGLRLSKEEIVRQCARFGHIARVSILFGVFYIIYDSASAAEKAARELHGHQIGGYDCELTAHIFKPS